MNRVFGGYEPRCSVWLPVFSGVSVPVGPWRGIRLLDRGIAAVVSAVKHASVDGTTGRVAVSARLTGLPASLEYVTVRVGEHSRQLAVSAGPDGFLEVSGVVEVPDAQLWWPHTHGTPRTYRVTMEAVGVSEHLGSVGFRTVEVDRSDGGFRLYVNGIRVYCRGSVWVPTDPISLQGDAGTTRVLERLAEAGLNMIRIPGTMVYESDHFWEECARLGILVWQDMMLATLDPPDTDESSNSLPPRSPRSCTECAEIPLWQSSAAAARPNSSRPCWAWSINTSRSFIRDCRS